MQTHEELFSNISHHMERVHGLYIKIWGRGSINNNINKISNKVLSMLSFNVILLKLITPVSQTLLFYMMGGCKEKYIVNKYIQKKI